VKLALVIALCTGCSFVMTKGPDTGNPPRAYPSCTSSMTWPIVDIVLSAAFLSATIQAAADDDQMSNLDEGEANKASKVTSAALFTVASAAGAVFGWRRVSSCRAAQEQFMAANPMGTQPYSYPYTYQQQPYYPQQQPAVQPQPQPPAPPPVVPQQQPPASALGTEGDVCSASTDCATGLACANDPASAKNVCVRPPAR
jgi:hypothetical protein